MHSVAQISSGLNLLHRREWHKTLDLNESTVYQEVRMVDSNRSGKPKTLIAELPTEELENPYNVGFPSGPHIQSQVWSNTRNTYPRARIRFMPFERCGNLGSLLRWDDFPRPSYRHSPACFQRDGGCVQGSTGLDDLRRNLTTPRVGSTTVGLAALRRAHSPIAGEYLGCKGVAAKTTQSGFHIVPMLLAVAGLASQGFSVVFIRHRSIIPQRILQKRRDPAAFDDRLNYEHVLAVKKPGKEG